MKTLAIKPFYLQRKEDVSGVSGTGIVAVGVQLPSGKCVIEWIVTIPSIVIYDTIDQLTSIHSHEGKTEIKWGPILQ